MPSFLNSHLFTSLKSCSLFSQITYYFLDFCCKDSDLWNNIPR